MTNAERALLAIVGRDAHTDRASAVQELRADDWPLFLESCRQQRVSSFVYQRIRDLGLAGQIPADVMEALSSEARRTAHRVLRLHSELRALLDRCALNDIPLVLLKGACVGTRVYGSPALRDMGDLDVLVRVDHLERAADVVRALGYVSLHPFNVEVDRAISHHLTRFVKRGCGAIELHWNVFAPGRPQSIDPAELWARAIPCDVAGRRTRSLCNEDLLLHLCLHTSYQHLFGFGIRSLCDVTLLLDRPDLPPDLSPGLSINWQDLCERARARRWDKGAWLALTLARDLLGAGVPADALRTLQPPNGDEPFISHAREQLFADPRDLVDLVGEISRIAEAQSFSSRLRHVRDRVFLDRTHLAALFNRRGDMSFAEQLSLYPVRAVDLIRRHGRTALRLLRRHDSSLSSTALRQHALRAWLNE